MKLLLDELPSKEYRQLMNLQTDWHLRLRKHFKIRRGAVGDLKKDTIFALHEMGVTYARLKEDLLNVCGVELGKKINRNIPTVKIAILVGNAQYTFWPRLSTPTSDCVKLKNILKNLGYAVIVIENIETINLITVLQNLLKYVPENSYVLFYFAGHGLEFNSIKFMMGIECPPLESLSSMESAISENFLMKQILERKPELLVLLLDICREPPDRKLNEELYKTLPPLEEFQLGSSNFFIGCSTSPYMPSFEKKLQPTSDEKTSNVTLNAEDSGVSLYVEYLCKHLLKDLDFNEILKMVHNDVAQDSYNRIPMQKPQKSDNTNSPFYLNIKSKGDENSIAMLTKEVEVHKLNGLVIYIF